MQGSGLALRLICRSETTDRGRSAAAPLNVAAILLLLISNRADIDQETRKILLTASMALIGTSLLGGLVKLVLDDVDRGRQQRGEQVQFLLTVLSDLKSVYDRAERSKVLIAAHQSAKTFGDEMRGLIDARTKLLSVSRSVKANQLIGESERNELDKHVTSMASYLTRLINEFRDHYISLSQMQRRYESAMDEYVKAAAVDPLKAVEPKYDVWDKIIELQTQKDFLQKDEKNTSYYAQFLQPLDEASKVISNELKRVFG
jgi:hypothetical protein